MALLDTIKLKIFRRGRRTPLHREVVATMRRAQALHNGKLTTRFDAVAQEPDLAQVAREAGL